MTDAVLIRGKWIPIEKVTAKMLADEEKRIADLDQIIDDFESEVRSTYTQLAKKEKPLKNT